MFGLRASTAVVAASLSMVLAVGGASARTTGPTVVAGWKDGPVAIPSSSTLGLIATLKVPAGRWVAWAKLFVDSNTTDWAVDVTCVLRASGRAANAHRGEVTVAPNFVGAPTQPLALTSRGKFGDTGGKFYLKCAADGGAGEIKAHWIKIMAMRVGTLTTVNLASGNKTTVGSGKPKVIVASHSGPISPGGKCSPDACQDFWEIGPVWIGPGAWWLRASATFDTTDPGGQVDGRCTFNMGDSADAVETPLDGVTVTRQERSVIPVMDTAFSSPTGKWVAAYCDASDDYSPPSPWLGDARITAVQLSTLVTWPRGVAVTYGSGWPKAKFKAATWRHLPDGNWSTLSSVPVEAGKWMFLGKPELSGMGAATCQLLASPDYDQTGIGFGENASLSLPFAVVHVFSGPGTATLRCQPVGDLGAGQIRLTAFKLGSLQNIPLN
jgi:hypothetical protein